MSEENPVSVKSIPADGDVVVRSEIREDGRVYILQTGRGDGQILYRTHDAAVAQAVAFAKENHVCVWIGNGDRDYTLFENFRQAEQV